MQSEQPKEAASNIERLINELADTNRYLRHTFALKMIILRGLVTGVAIVVGSTVFASIIFALIQLIFGDIPFIPTVY